MKEQRKQYRVAVVNCVGVEHLEGATDELSQAEQHARDAIDDGCRSATVRQVANGHPVSHWDVDILAQWRAEQRWQQQFQALLEQARGGAHQPGVPTVRRYRKTATVRARQLAVGEVETLDTLEGPATATGPHWVVTANTALAESWPVSDDYFRGPYGYEATGEVIDGLLVYRKKPGADVLAYQVTTDDHEPVPMAGLDKPFPPSRGYRVAFQLDGSHRRAIAPAVFAADWEPSTQPVP